MNHVIRTLIVDDSAFVRKVVREMLSRSPYIEVVGAARDGNEALELSEQLKPDVITCDLTMPGLDGVKFVREQMSRKPTPILILSSTPQDGAGVLEAIEAGAIDFIQKPSARATEQIFDIRQELVDKIKAASAAPLMQVDYRPVFPTTIKYIPRRLKVDMVVIGISTGGPQALRKVIPQFPASFPVPVAIVLHMPVGYTQLYAEKLDEISEMSVKEVSDGEIMVAGGVYIAQAGRHLALRRLPNGQLQSQLSVKPLDTPHRPSVDVLFKSAADLFGSRVLAVVMTGMGADGKEGAAWVKAQGGTVLTEAEASCVIYGMPRSVVESGLSDRAIPLERMAQTIMECL